MKKYSLLLSICFCCSLVQGQSSDDAVDPTGSFYAYWGWNSTTFSKSNIRFTGASYDFTLRGVRAKDKQTPFDVRSYFSPSQATIPQYNFRIGYFINKKYNLSLAIDHMKYVIVYGQQAEIDGYIDEAENAYNGVYDKESFNVKYQFLRFEHTDGLNYINLSLRREERLKHWRKWALNGLAGIETGILLPRSNVTLMGKERYDEFHLAGYGFALPIGLKLLFANRFFVQSEAKGGFINMPDIRTTPLKEDKAAQSFFYFQSNIVFGVNWNIR